jgi:hypothetical protein
METSKLVEFILENLKDWREKDAVAAVVRTWLEEVRGLHVCEGTAEIRTLALENTDLVEPE